MPQFQPLLTSNCFQKEGASDSEPTDKDVDMWRRLQCPCPEAPTITAYIIYVWKEGGNKLELSKYRYVTSAAYGISKSSVYRTCRGANTFEDQNIAVFF
jgi:hypothetical protein